MPHLPELIIILVIVLLIFGVGKLPQLGDALGKGIRNFKKATKGEDEIDVTPRRDELPSSERTAAATGRDPEREGARKS